MTKVMLDLCSGLGGASSSFRDAGWHVITLDNDPGFGSDITVDIRLFQPSSISHKIDFIWFSPPCTEFAREYMPWSKTGKAPDLSVLYAGLNIIKYFNPEYYLIENVKGAITWFYPVLGNYRVSYDPYYLWGFFPVPGKLNKSNWVRKSRLSSSSEFQRSKIPYNLSRSICQSVSIQKVLL